MPAGRGGWPTTVSTFACATRRARSATPYQSRRVVGADYRAPTHPGGKWASLSPRERAGVRGNAAANRRGAARAAGNSGVGPTFNAVTADYSPGAVPIPPYQTAVYIIRVK